MRHFSLELGWICVFACTALGQSTKAELFGTIRDADGLPVAAAVVELANNDTGAMTIAEPADGAYHFFGLVPGNYELRVAKPGFETQRRTGLSVRVGDRLNFDFELHLGDAAQSVTVTVTPPLLQSNRGSTTYLMEREKLASLPLDGRTFVPLIALSPGVSLQPGSVLPRINGSRPRTSEYIYDGVSVLQPEPGQVAFYPIVDSIEEFRVETSGYSAEYGRSNGGVILVNQKSGANALHGSLFEFFRHERVNARNLFAETGPNPKLRRNQYGFVLGGPVQRNTTFFFVDWQSTRLGTGVVRTSTVPTVAQRRGVFTQPVFDPFSTRLVAGGAARDVFPDGVVPGSYFDRAAISLAERYPLPNVLERGGELAPNNYRRVAAETTAQDQFDTRIDRYLNPKQHVFARYTFLRDHSRPAPPLPDGSGALSSAYLGDTITRADGFVGEHSWNVTPVSVNQARFGHTRRGFHRSALSGQQERMIPNVPLSSYPGVLPVFDVVGLQQLGPPASANGRFGTSVTQLIDNYSWSARTHSLKAGADIRLERLDVLMPPYPSGSFQFTSIFTAGIDANGAPVTNTGNSFASFLLGQVTRFSIDVQSEVLKPRATVAEFFLQDDWRVTRRLSINLGVRYTLNMPSTIVRDQGAVFNLRNERLDYLGRDGFSRSARNLERTNFAPRVGFAYRATESLVVRSAYSLTWIEQAGITTPFTAPLFPFAQTLGEQSLDNIRPAFQLSLGPTVVPRALTPDAGLGQGTFATQRDNGSGYAQQWNLSLQKTWRDSWNAEVGYLGSKLTRLGVPDVNLNQLTVDQLSLGSQLTQQVSNPYFGQIHGSSVLGGATIAKGQLLRPYPRFTTVALYRNNVGHSTYHSLQARVERRFARGLNAGLSYTFSRLIDDAGAVFDAAVLTGPVISFQAADGFNRRLEKDVSTGNVPHIVAANGVYDLPIGQGRAHQLQGWRNALLGRWQVAGTLRLQSGSPLAVTQATNLNAFAGFGIQRPNRAANPLLPADQRTTSRYFNQAAFAQAPQFTIGTSSRNPVVGPGFRSVEVMLGKTFALSEQLRAEFRAEAFNVANTPPLSAPNTSFGNAAFGRITTALDPRVFEFVLKIHF